MKKREFQMIALSSKAPSIEGHFLCELDNGEMKILYHTRDGLFWDKLNIVNNVTHWANIQGDKP